MSISRILTTQINEWLKGTAYEARAGDMVPSRFINIYIKDNLIKAVDEPVFVSTLILIVVGSELIIRNKLSSYTNDTTKHRPHTHIDLANPNSLQELEATINEIITMHKSIKC